MPSPSATTETRPVPTDPETPQPRLGLSLPQVVGSAMAAVSAAVAASWLGVAGTIIGAAVGSIFGTVGTAIYAQTLRHGGDAVRRIRPSRDGREVSVGAPSQRERLGSLRERLRALPWRRLAAASAVALVLAFGILTAVEKLTGQPISGGDGGTTLSRVAHSSNNGSDDSQNREEPGRGGDQEQPSEGASTPSEDGDQDSEEGSGQDSDPDSEQPSDEPTDTEEPTEAPTEQPSEQPTPEAPAPDQLTVP